MRRATKCQISDDKREIHDYHDSTPLQDSGQDSHRKNKTDQDFK